MEGIKIKLLQLAFLLVLLQGCRGQRELIDCGTKEFFCRNSTHFYICVDFIIGNYTFGDPLPCGVTLCSNNDTMECSSLPPPAATTLRPTTRRATTRRPTTRKPITVQPTTRRPTTRKPITVQPATRRPTTKKPSVCTTAGHTTDPSAVNCKTYINCVKINNTYVESKETCPYRSVYDPVKRCCSISYQCNGGAVPCKAIERTPNSGDSTCRSFYLCVRTHFGGFERNKYYCPSKCVFSPYSQRCVKSDRCVAPPPTPPPKPIVPAACLKSRKAVTLVPNPNVPCIGFIRCIRLSSTNIQVSEDTCFSGSFFSPFYSSCVYRWMYNCRIPRTG